MPYLRLHMIGVDEDLAAEIERLALPLWDTAKQFWYMPSEVSARWEYNGRTLELQFVGNHPVRFLMADGCGYKYSSCGEIAVTDLLGIKKLFDWLEVPPRDWKKAINSRASGQIPDS